MVELADALGSGPSECKLVGVQFPPSAIFFAPTAPTLRTVLSMENLIDRIEVLPQSVVEKIAAGEIIERPASVLKELMENAIDAGATKIDISIEDAGFACIRVIDNGRGMTPQNLRKSVLRHATSKIRSAEDLYAIGTMGFRGEALASICAVSRMTIASSPSDEGLGHSLQCDGGIAAEITPFAHIHGSTVIVRDLFFNVPARKKFMKTRTSERNALMRCIEQVAVPFPGVHFSASFEGKSALDMPATESIAGRIAQIAGVQFAKDLITCEAHREGMEAVIYVSAPGEARSKPRFQNIYVNDRKVDNDQVVFAVREASAQFIKTEFRPSFFCCIDIDPARVDVNVHPSKLKVKFEDERTIFGFIFNAVRRGISSTLSERGDVVGQRTGEEGPVGPMLAGGRCIITEIHRLDEGPGSPYDYTTGNPDDQNARQTVLSFPADATKGQKNLDFDAAATVQLSESPREQTGNISCYQVHSMFILAPIKNGILLIDQHAAHERVLYEQALADVAKGRAESQQLLFPIVIELSPTEKSVVQSGNEFFSAFGFDIQDFGGAAVSISALPAFLKDSQAEEALRDMVRYLLEEKKEALVSDPQKRFAAAFACGAAIKAGQKLSQEEMNALLNSLFGTENPYTCPHGRPTLVRMSLDELSRRFLR